MVFLMAYIVVFKAETIKNGFVATGIVPFNPECILEILNIVLKTPIPPAS